MVACAPCIETLQASCGVSQATARQGILIYVNLFLWVFSSVCLIIQNKYILVPFGFPFPCTLTLFHMIFCSSLSWLFIKTKLIEKPDMSAITVDVFFRGMLPVSALFAISLFCNNAAYSYLSVSILQMVKASTPAVVYLVGVALFVEEFQRKTFLVMIIIFVGVLIASYGEVAFSWIGFIFQASAVVAEGVRIVLIQKLLQAKGVKITPIASMAFVLPVCAFFLLPMWYLYELPALRNFEMDNMHDKMFIYIFAANGCSAFFLNYIVFSVIQKSSALTMNICGVVKDWLLIILSSKIFHDAISKTSFFGYSVAFAGVAYYQHEKLHSLRKEHNEGPPIHSIKEETQETKTESSQ